MIIDCSHIWLKIREQIAIDRELIASVGWECKLPRIIVYGRGVGLECEE